LKINVDAYFLEMSRSGEWGFIIRNDSNEDGEALAVGAGHIVSMASPFQAEALACWKALLFAADRGMMMVEMESDCVTLKQALSSKDFDSAPEGVLFREMKFFMLSSFNDVKIMSISSLCNSVAHSLASEETRLLGGAQNLWPEGNPDFVNSLLANDLSLCPS
jgi:hypothetical protein